VIREIELRQVAQNRQVQEIANARGISLIPSLEMSRELSRTGETLEEIKKGLGIHSPAEIKIANLPEAPRVEVEAPAPVEVTVPELRIPQFNVPSLPEPKAVNVNIIIQGPFYIREEADIIKLASKIGKLQMSRMTRIRGRV